MNMHSNYNMPIWNINNSEQQSINEQKIAIPWSSNFQLESNLNT